MKVYLKDIAAALNVCKRTIQWRSNHEKWPFITESVRGGQCKVFDSSVLPKNIRHAVMHWSKITAKPIGARFELERLAEELAELSAEVSALKARLKHINSQLPKGTEGKLSAADLKRLGIKA